MFTEKRICQQHKELPVVTIGTAIGTRLKQHNDGNDVSDDQYYELVQRGSSGPVGKLIRDDFEAGAGIIQTPTFRKDERFYRSSIQIVREVIGKSTEKCILAVDFGSKEDCYSPEDAPDTEDSEKFHGEKIKNAGEYLEGDNEILWFETINSVTEAIGISIASLLQKEVPLAINFVIHDNGKLLDGNEVYEAIHEIQQAARKRVAPVYFGVNCCSTVGGINANHALQSRNMKGLDISYINASDQCGANFDGSNGIENLPPENVAKKVSRIHTRVSGVCCGGTHEHVRAIREHQEIL